MLLNIPNSLSLLRIAVIPVLVALHFMPGAAVVWISVVVFSIGALTDFFDGYVARTYNQTSVLGRFLDTIADKLLVNVVLMLLISAGTLDGYWIILAIIILMRELLVTGTREFLAPYNFKLPTTMIAKWKATIQFVSLGFLMAGTEGPTLVPYSLEIGKFTLLIATILTVISGWDYVSRGYKMVIDLGRKNKA